MKKKQKFYTVWIGRNPGVYMTWEDCKAQIFEFENAVYKSFSSIEQANEAFKANSDKYIGIDAFESPLTSQQLETIGNPLIDSICVDGAWNTATNRIEYQGVRFSDGVKLFHAGPFSAGTNNIAEFLAIVHALTYCKSNSLKSNIYSDSSTAISWVKKKKASTKIELVESTIQIMSIVKRAENWLLNNEYDTKILKWETAAWGENPADFGRK